MLIFLKIFLKIPKSSKSFSSVLSKTPSIMDSCFFQLTTPIEIINIVNELNSSKSAGFDEISTFLLKCVISYIAEPLSYVLNLALNNGIFPKKMKLAKVCPIFKAGDKSDFSNYRPISLLSSFSKIFEKVIATRIISFIEKHSIISLSQYGFRKKHSTYMAIMKLHEAISEAIDNNEYCIGIFIDLSKAFDTLNHTILLEKLNYYGIRGCANNLIKNYLQNREQYVQFNNCTSSKKSIEYGVPQGSILGPLLFILYINDIVNVSKVLRFILFADDTNILYSNRNLSQLVHVVNCELDLLSTWFKANKLSLNVKKTNFMLFGHKNYSINITDISIDTTLESIM